MDKIFRRCPTVSGYVRSPDMVSGSGPTPDKKCTSGPSIIHQCLLTSVSAPNANRRTTIHNYRQFKFGIQSPTRRSNVNGAQCPSSLAPTAITDRQHRPPSPGSAINPQRDRGASGCAQARPAAAERPAAVPWLCSPVSSPSRSLCEGLRGSASLCEPTVQPPAPFAWPCCRPQDPQSSALRLCLFLVGELILNDVARCKPRTPRRIRGAWCYISAERVAGKNEL